MARAAAETIPCTAAKTAVALVTRLATAPDVPRDDLLAGADPCGVLVAMEIITAGILAGVWPAGEGMDALGRIGVALAALEGAES